MRPLQQHFVVVGFAFTILLTPVRIHASEPSPRSAAQIETVAYVPNKLGAVFETMNVCAGPTPAGWIKINDQWNPTSCGNPSSGYNVMTISRLASLPIGTNLTACAGQSVPSGWILVGYSHNPMTCGHPNDGAAQNVMQIRRVS
jgi:hypothetical protein